MKHISKIFVEFAELECRGSSPLYEKLSLGISGDAELLGLAANSNPGQPIPNLFLAAVHFLLMTGIKHELSNFYQDLSDPAPPANSDPYDSFRSFCLTHSDEIVEIISTRRVQTNVVERCALLLPAFDLVAQRNAGLPLALVEIGASAGLNLIWDRYGYNYINGEAHGDMISPVQIETTLEGELRPTISNDSYQISHRVGIDLNPIDVQTRDAVMWLRALVWPENTVRLQRMNTAIELVRQDPPTILQGNALDLLPNVLDSVPEDSALCVYHTHTINQFSNEDRERLDSILSAYGQNRNLYWISSEYRPQESSGLNIDSNGQMRAILQLTTFEEGTRSTKTLARCDPHGRWLEWLATSG